MVKVKAKFKSKAGRIRKPKQTSRWAKGDSCLSNPEIHKFRDEASSLYFHEVVKNPLLTARNLGSRNLPGQDVDEDVLSADVQSLTVSDARTGFGSFATYKTFASDWSKCSNGAFEKFLGRFKLDSALHKEMLSILAATTEVINSMGGTHRETEYFASFVTALDQCESTQYPAMMALLSIVSGKVPEAVLRRTFATIYPRVGCVLTFATDSFDNSLMRVTCDVLKKVLGAQDPNIFESELPVQSLIYGILRCALHDNPKVRRKGRTTIGFILNRQKEKNGNDTVAKIVLGWVLDQLATYPTCGSKAAGDTIGLLQFVWSNLDSVSSAGAKKLYESVLRIMSSGDMSLVKIGFSFFSVVFQTHLTIDSSSLSARPENIFTPKLVTALWDFSPDWRNNDAFLLWLTCMMNGLIRLAEDESRLAGPFIPRLMEAIAPTWTCHWGAIPSKVFVDYLFHLLQPEKTSNEDIEASFQVLSKNLISIPPNEHCLTVLTGFLDALKPEQFTISGREVLLQLLQLRHSSAAPKINSILGRFVKSFGIDNLWISVDPDMRHSVILPLVRDNLSEGQFSYWKENVFPLHKNPTLVKDVWGSLVGFCRNPVDPENFPAKFIGESGIKVPVYRLTALAALRQFCMWPQAKPVLQKHGNNFLAILFNEYIGERQVALEMKKKSTAEQANWKNAGHSDAIGTTIQEYLPAMEPKEIQELLGVAIKKFNGATVEEKGPILDLVVFLSVFPIKAEIESQLVEIASAFVSDPVHMKRAYRLVQSLLNNDSVTGDTVTEIVALLSESKGKTKSNAEPLRLECIISLLLKDESWWAEFLPEAILSLLSVNTRARRVAIKFVAKLCESLKDQKISLEKLANIVKLGLESGNSFIISCTIHFLTRVFMLAPPPSPDETLINNCVNHLLLQQDSGGDAAVSREALTFISLNLSLYKTRMGPFAASIGKILAVDKKTLGSSGEGFPRKEVNKILGRMIRVFGVAGLRAVLPNADDPKMTTRIKNIQRKMRKMKETKAEGLKKRESEKEADSDEAESEEDEEDAGKSRRSNHRTNEKLIMKEGVVDFLDPKNMTASLISKPREMKKDGDEFKFSSEGKLIIEDLDERRGKKRRLEEDNRMGVGGSDDEDELDDDELAGKRQKKKAKAHGGSSVASSRRTMKSSRSMKSVSSVRSGKSSGGVSRKTVMMTATRAGSRPQLKAKRSRKGGSNQSVRSGKSNRSSGGGHKERFNYKR